MNWRISPALLGAALALCVSVAGCASHVSPQMAAMASAPLAPGKGRVIVIRPDSLSDALTPWIADVHLSVDGTDYGVLESRSYKVINLAPGEHELRLFRYGLFTSTGFNRDARLRLNVASDQTVYEGYRVVQDGFNIPVIRFTKMTEQQAQSEMAQLTGNGS